MRIEYTEVNGWSINGKPAEESEARPILKEHYKERQAIDQLMNTGAVKIEI